MTEIISMNGKDANGATLIKSRARGLAKDAAQETDGAMQNGTMAKRRTTMILADFIKVLDTTEPIMVYLDGLEDKAYDTEKIPSWYKQLEVTNVYVDDEGLGVAIYTA